MKRAKRDHRFIWLIAVNVFLLIVFAVVWLLQEEPNRYTAPQRAFRYTLFALFLASVAVSIFYLILYNVRRQQRLAEMKNEFVSNLIHELKTPLTTVGLALAALDDTELNQHPDRVHEYLGISRLELERLNLLVDKMLQISVLEDQAPRLNFQVINVAQLIPHVLNALRLQAQHTGANIQVHLPAGDTFPVYADRLHLTNILLNLLDNALKYRHPTAPSIEVFLEKTTQVVRLMVRDNGPGIAAQDQQKVFEKFFRAPKESLRRGHGLGLHYVADMVRRHGGNIFLDSNLGQGSTFIIELPAAHPLGALPH